MRGEGCRVWDGNGRSYLDGTASLWYCAAGHGRREIIDAITAQLGELEAYHTFARFTNRPEQRLAELLIDELQPIPNARVLFTCGGSEAIDSAIKLVRAGHKAAGDGGRTVFLSRHYAYHGVMLGGTSAGGLPANRDPFGTLLPDFYQVDRDSLDAMRDAVAYHGPERIAGIVAEPVIGAGGVFPPTDGYLQGLRELCDECGALLVFDEVITGFGRLGSWFASHHYGVTPDVTTFAKAVTSGYLPLGGVSWARGCASGSRPIRVTCSPTANTYGGHPTCCAAGVANLELMRAEDLPARAAAAGRAVARGVGRFARSRRGGRGARRGADAGDRARRTARPPVAFTEALLARGVIGRGLPYANTRRVLAAADHLRRGGRRAGRGHRSGTR